jgi:hypothetical protein
MFKVGVASSTLISYLYIPNNSAVLKQEFWSYALVSNYKGKFLENALLITKIQCLLAFSHTMTFVITIAPPFLNKGGVVNFSEPLQNNS